VANNPEQVSQIASQLEKATDRGCGMVEELLLFARKTEAHLILVDIPGQIHETVQMLRSSLPENISLTLHLEEDLPWVWADIGQVDRILTNLIVNARDAMPNGGNLTISSDAVKFDHIPTNSWQIKNTPYLRVQVSDTGMGMDETTQTRIFEPFFTTKPVGKGTGLGLSVVFGLMEAHHGFIDLQSQVNRGTTFSLFFPWPSGTELTPERIHAIAPTQLLGETIPCGLNS
jgi:signal transduction histidine kinase